MAAFTEPAGAVNPGNPAETVIVDEDDPLLQPKKSDHADGISYGTLEPTITDQASSDDQNDLESVRSKNEPDKVSKGVYTTISIMMLGVFLGQVDTTLVLATYGKVSSEFNDLDQGTWIITAYIIAACAAQPLYGKLGDIYGRKACLQTSYILFTLGTAGTALAPSMGLVVASRAVQGAGGAGMSSMVSIIVTDLVPLNEVATIRSYVNVLQTTGRSCGGAIGGLLTEAFGWRAAFGLQVPLMAGAFILVQWRLRLSSKEESEETKWQKLKRVDFIGATFLCFAISAICIVLEVGGAKLPWDSPVILGFGVASAVSLVCFIVSAKLVAEPIFPLRLVKNYVVVTNYLVNTLTVMTQFLLMMLVPLCYQVISKASVAAAGLYLIPAFVGNTAGGLLSGWWIQKTGRYKPPTILAPAVALIGQLLCYFFWSGENSFIESLATLPGGFAAGMVYNSAFVGLAAGIAQEDMSIAGTGMYLFFNFGGIAATGVGTAVFQSALKSALKLALQGVPGRKDIIRRSLEDIQYVQNADEELRSVITPAFVSAFHRTNLVGVGCSTAALIVAVFVKGKRLEH